jgi:phenylacetate-coenzyme A ligase PaaK-like adenylate-forming protein
MKSALLKKINNVLPGPVKRLLGPLIRRKLHNNEVFLSQLAELEQMEQKTETEIKKNQFAKLRKTMIHAYEHTNYYKKLFDGCGFNAYHFAHVDEMQKIPLLKRADIINNFADLKADDIADFYLSTTGGSSGPSLEILLSKDSIYRERAFIYHFWAQYGYDYKTAKMASFRGGIDFKEKIHRYNPLYNEVQLNPCLINADTIGKYLNLIDKFKADFLHGLPSAIYTFCKFANEAKARIKNQYQAVFFISENVYEYQREYIEETLGIKTYAYYGHTERAVFAGQSGEGYRFNDNYCFVEFKDEGQSEQQNSIITTGFINPKMPLIRYELDDTATPRGSSAVSPEAKAIRPATATYQITGHRDGILYGKNGEIISAASLYIHDSAMDKVANLQFIQDEIGAVKLLISPLNELFEDDRKAINNYYQEKLGTSMVIEVEIVTEMIFTSRGKMPLIVQNCKPT